MIRHLTAAIFIGALCQLPRAAGIQSEHIRAGIEMVFEGRFDEARSCLRSGSRGNEIMSRFLEHWLLLEEGDQDSLLAFARSAEDQLSMLKNTPHLKPHELKFYEGLWNGLLALYFVKQDNLVKAYKAGRRAYEKLRQCLMENPEQYDAYYGLGLYHKMKFELAGSCWFVPQSERDGEIAGKYFRMALQKGIFTRELSEHMLIELSF